MKQGLGLTIVEALIAMAVFGIVFVGLASLQITSMRLTSDARAESQLLEQAVTKFEALRTTVLANFRGFYEGCPDACPFFGDYGDVVISSFAGLLEITITEEQDGRSLVFKQYVSCLDSENTPTLSDTTECKG
jgi:Tfp pilus assembly protein PilV